MIFQKKLSVTLESLVQQFVWLHCDFSGERKLKGFVNASELLTLAILQVTALLLTIVLEVQNGRKQNGGNR